MPATPENAALNMRTLRANIIAQLGLPAAANEWTFDQRVAYLRELADGVVRYPNSFTAEQLATAERIRAANYGELADTSFDTGEFIAGALDNVPEVLGSVGKYLLLAAVVLGAVWIVTTKPKLPTS